MFVHGYPLDRTIWRDQIEALDGFRRIAPDLRGMGASDAPDLGYSIPIYAADLAALLDTLSVDEVILCGLSMGGYVALEFVRQWRHRVRGLILMDTRADADGPDVRRARDAAAAQARERGSGVIAESMLPKVLARGHPHPETRGCRASSDSDGEYPGTRNRRRPDCDEGSRRQ